MSFQGSGALSGGAQGLSQGTQIGSAFGPKGLIIGGAAGLIGGTLMGGFGGGKVKAAENALLTNQNILAQQQQVKAMQAQGELDELERPEISAEVDRIGEIASLAERYAREGMPEAQREAAATDIQRNQAMQLGAMGGLGAGLRGLGNTQASTAQSYRQLAAQDAAIAQQNQGQYLGALEQLAGAEARQEQFNVVDPYYEDFNRLYLEKQAMEGAAIQNRFGALNYNLQLQQQRNAATQQGFTDLGNSISSFGGGAGGASGIAGAFGGGGGGSLPSGGASSAMGSGLDMNAINSTTPFSAGFTP